MAKQKLAHPFSWSTICLILAPATMLSQLSAQDASTTASITWVNTAGAKTLPTGVEHHTFFSASAQQDVGYCIYLPPNYGHSQDRYPVIYNLHGNGGNEFHSFEDVQLLHTGIIDRRVPPMIVVLPNGGKSTFYKDSFDGKFPIETMLIRELIPHVDSNYRTIAARHGRCIEGFSMGGRGATRLAMKYPQMFCSLFCQAGNVPRTLASYDPSKLTEYPNNYLGPDRENFVDNDAFELLKKNRDAVSKLRIQILCGTRDDEHIATIRDFHQALLDAKVDHTYIELEGFGHQRTKIIEHMRKTWFDYHVESLRLASKLESNG